MGGAGSGNGESAEQRNLGNKRRLQNNKAAAEAAAQQLAERQAAGWTEDDFARYNSIAFDFDKYGKVGFGGISGVLEGLEDVKKRRETIEGDIVARLSGGKAKDYADQQGVLALSRKKLGGSRSSSFLTQAGSAGSFLTGVAPMTLGGQ